MRPIETLSKYAGLKHDSKVLDFGHSAPDLGEFLSPGSLTLVYDERQDAKKARLICTKTKLCRASHRWRVDQRSQDLVVALNQVRQSDLNRLFRNASRVLKRGGLLAANLGEADEIEVRRRTPEFRLQIREPVRKGKAGGDDLYLMVRF